ncbi:hypothetical protein SprV_0301239200 [Sparganum proliferum]
MSQIESATWNVNLPLVLLGIRSSVKEDIQCTAAELVYGTPLRLPGEFVQPSTTNTNISSTFVQLLKQRKAQMRPKPTRLKSKRVFVYEDLKSTPFVFVRHDAVSKSLCSPYDGPYKNIHPTANDSEEGFIFHQNDDSNRVEKTTPVDVVSTPEPQQ